MERSQNQMIRRGLMRRRGKILGMKRKTKRNLANLPLVPSAYLVLSKKVLQRENFGSRLRFKSLVFFADTRSVSGQFLTEINF